MKSISEHTFSRPQFVKLGGGSVVALALAGCASNGGGSSSSASSDDGSSDTKSIKPGFITLHDENSTYDLNFINAAKEACKELGISEDTYMIKTNIPEGQECYNAAAELADAGCSIIFADSFGHEDYMIQAAKEFPDIQFCHSTGTKAHTEGLDNYHNAFASIYEGRYLAGVAAGMKINEMIDSGKITANQAKTGYVGAYTYAEVISGYTSFFLGARSVCPSATMEVTFTGSWYDETVQRRRARLSLSTMAAYSSPSTRTPWARLPLARTPASWMSPITAARRMPAPTPSLSLPASTGFLTTSTQSRP